MGHEFGRQPPTTECFVRNPTNIEKIVVFIQIGLQMAMLRAFFCQKNGKITLFWSVYLGFCDTFFCSVLLCSSAHGNKI